MTSAQVITNTARRVSNLGLSERGLPIGAPGTVLFAMYASVGAVAELGISATWNQAILGITPHEGKADARFLRYWLKHLATDLGAIARSNTQDNLNADQVANLPFPSISVTEQHAIADFLDTETARIDALISKKRRTIALVDERFEATIFHAVTRGLQDQRDLKPSGLSWVQYIPSDWSTPAVSANFDLQLGKMLNVEAAEGPDQYPYLRNTNVQWDRFELADLATMHFSPSDRRRCDLRPGDLLVCEGGEVGRSAVWDGELDDCYFQKAIHRVRPRKRANSRYLMYCLRAAAKQNVFSVEGNLSTIVHLTGEQLRVHRFPWPSDEEQAEIVTHLDNAVQRVHQLRAALSRQIDLLIERRQALITAAVTGELDVAATAS